MAFRWKDYLELAVVLKAQGESLGQESCLRSATSRAYYAAYCHARNWAHENHRFDILNKPKDHKRLRDHFRGNDMEHIADKLDDMRKWRNKCDYRNDVSNPKRMAGDAIREAQDIFRSL